MAPPVCSECTRILSGSYYEAGKRILCAGCGEKRKAKNAGLLGFFRVRVRGPIPFSDPLPPPGQV